MIVVRLLDDEFARTSMCSVLTLGKHLRKLASISTSEKTPKFTFTANISTPGTTVPGLAIVSGCSTVHQKNMHITL